MPSHSSSSTEALTPPSPVKASLIVTLAAALSRVLGFVRDILIAFVFGGGPVAEALLLALRIPAFLRRLFSEGGVNAAYVPLYLAIKHRSGQAGAGQDGLGADESGHFAAAALINAALLLCALWAISHVAAPMLMAALAGGVPQDSQIVVLASEFSRAALPVVVGSGLAALMSARLNADGRFALAAFSALVVNLVMIAVLVVLAARGTQLEQAAYLFALTWSAAGFLHVILLGAGKLWAGSARPREGAVSTLRNGAVSTPREGAVRAHLGASWRALAHLGLRALWSADQRQLASTMGPGLLVAAAPLAMLLAATPGAALLPSGIACLYYADRLAQLPLGFVGTAASIVLLPHIARKAMVQDGSNQSSTLIDQALAAALALVLPASVALVVLAQPIVSVLFERGAFSPEDTGGTTAVLMGLVIAAPFAAAARVLSQDFLARSQWLAPVTSATISLVVTGVASFAGASFAGAPGLGLGIATGALVQSILLTATLIRQRRWHLRSWLLIRIACTALASLIMAGALVWAISGMQPWLAAEMPTHVRVAALAALCLGGLGVYAGAGGLLLLLLQLRRA